MIRTAGIAGVAMLVLAGSASAQPASADLKTRLAGYEKRAAAGRPDDAELAAIALTVLEQVATRATSDAVVVQACTSSFVPPAAGCSERLWRIARSNEASLAARAAASAALAASKAEGAEDLLLELATSTSPARFPDVASSLVVLPPERSVPVLSRILESNELSAKPAACRVLGQIDAFESRLALARFLDSTPRGTQTWFACTIAAARLGDGEALKTTRFITTYLRDFDLFSAADVLMSIDQDLAVTLLQKVTREATGLVRMEAAARLVTLRPDTAKALIEWGLQSTEPDLKAAALVVYRRLAVDPGREIRSLLADPEPLVRLRAAEVVLDAEARKRVKH